jgi:hypothetical protein
MITRSLAGSLLCALLAAGVARAAPSPPDQREAAERFDRGIRLYDSGDPTTALAEFHKAYELSGEPRILYNMALIYADLHRAVDAVEALERLLGDPRPLSPEQRHNAEELHAQQALLVARLSVRTSVPAQVEIDGVQAGRTPLARPLLVAAGTHVVGVVAQGYSPLRQRLDLAGGEKRDLGLTLVPEWGPATSEPTARHHDGLYLNLMLGGGFMSSSATAASQQLTYSGLAQSLSVAAGASVTERIAVYASLYDSIASSPSARRSNDVVTEAGSIAALGGGLGAEYFFMPLNASVGARLGLERFVRRDSDDSPTALSSWMPGLTLTAGKQWWLSDNWGVGGVLQLHWSTPLDAVSVDAFSTLWVVLGLSATYN